MYPFPYRLTGTKQSAFSTNHLADIDITNRSTAKNNTKQ